jgi:predicted adenine nucleotide alpha hydrolase (AANH) superfamily ATPase
MDTSREESSSVKGAAGCSGIIVHSDDEAVATDVVTAMADRMRLPNDIMPSDRHILKHITLNYDQGEDIIAVSDPVTETEQLFLSSFQIPKPGTRILLHSCCAPCSGAMIEEMKQIMDLDVTIFFYNPNIHPKKEYEIRKEENVKYATKHNIPFVDCDYDSSSWFKRMTGFELEPERGVRCSACFDMRMEVSAAYAVQHGFPYFTTTNATSRWKDDLQVNLSGIRAASFYQQRDNNPEIVQFWVYNWKSDRMTRRKYEVSVEERFYKQEYCGCSYSLRDSNIWRAQQGIFPVRIGGEEAGLGTRYFEDVDTDEAEESQAVVDAFFKDANGHFGDTTRLFNQQIKLTKHDIASHIYAGREKSTAAVSLNNW